MVDQRKKESLFFWKIIDNVRPGVVVGVWDLRARGNTMMDEVSASCAA